MHGLLGWEQLRPVTDVVHGTVIIYDIVFLNSVYYSSKQNQFVSAFLDLASKEATISKTKENLDRLKTEPLLALLLRICRIMRPMSFIFSRENPRRSAISLFPEHPRFFRQIALEIVEILPLSRRQIKKIGNVSIFPMPSQIFTMMAIINLVHGV